MVTVCSPPLLEAGLSGAAQTEALPETGQTEGSSSSSSSVGGRGGCGTRCPSLPLTGSGDTYSAFPCVTHALELPWPPAPLVKAFYFF